MHPAWLDTMPDNTPYYIRVDPENNYKSEEFLSLMAQYKYYIEHSPTRDKHAQGLAEHSVGIIATKTNVAMLAPTPAVPLTYWCLAMSYACNTNSLNYSKRIRDSPYHCSLTQYLPYSLSPIRFLNPDTVPSSLRFFYHIVIAVSLCSILAFVAC